MSELNSANPGYLAPFVCVECKRSFKRPIEQGLDTRPCPNCGQPAIRLDRKFKPPKAADNEQWKKVSLLIEHGYRFQSVYDSNGNPIAYPQTLKEAKAWIARLGTRTSEDR